MKFNMDGNKISSFFYTKQKNQLIIFKLVWSQNENYETWTINVEEGSRDNLGAEFLITETTFTSIQLYIYFIFFLGLSFA